MCQSDHYLYHWKFFLSLFCGSFLQCWFRIQLQIWKKLFGETGNWIWNIPTDFFRFIPSAPFLSFESGSSHFFLMNRVHPFTFEASFEKRKMAKVSFFNVTLIMSNFCLTVDHLICLTVDFRSRPIEFNRWIIHIPARLVVFVLYTFLEPDQCFQIVNHSQWWTNHFYLEQKNLKWP